MNQLHFERLKSAESPAFDTSMECYRTSFPYHEQREEESQKSIMNHEEYHFDMLMDEDRFVGLMLNWETDGWIYIEHFCIVPEQRNRQYGSRVLQMLAERGKNLVLEIDPPCDEISVRRSGFYGRAGFQTNCYPHIHPPYHRDCKGHPLVVLSSPREMTQREYERFHAFLRETVMKDVYD